jgi:hypothetical protein
MQLTRMKWLSFRTRMGLLTLDALKIPKGSAQKYSVAVLALGTCMSQEHLNMPDPAVLVDGIMEQRILQHICQGKPVQRLNCNGKDVSLHAIVDRIEFHIRLLNNRYRPIVILIDRERRRSTSREIATKMNSLLNERGFAGQFVLGVVDRCIENWILADWESVVVRFDEYAIRRSERKTPFESTQGKSELKRLLPRDLLYNEPTWGKDMFLRVVRREFTKTVPAFVGLSTASTCSAAGYCQSPNASDPYTNSNKFDTEFIGAKPAYYVV